MASGPPNGNQPPRPAGGMTMEQGGGFQAPAPAPAAPTMEQGGFGLHPHIASWMQHPVTQHIINSKGGPGRPAPFGGGGKMGPGGVQQFNPQGQQQMHHLQLLSQLLQHLQGPGSTGGGGGGPMPGGGGGGGFQGGGFQGMG